MSKADILQDLLWYINYNVFVNAFLGNYHTATQFESFHIWQIMVGRETF
jgi:hypothetical protein